MKKYTLLSCLLTILFLQFSPAQDEPGRGPSTKIKSALSEKGRIFIKDFYSLGTIRGKSGASMEFNAMIVYEPGKEVERLRGLKIAITADSVDKRNAGVYLDIDEMDNLNKVVVYMIGTAASSSWKYTTKDSAEVMFATKDNFRFGFYQKGMEQICFAECYDKIKLISYFDIENLKTVKLILDQAKTILSVK